MAVWTEFEKHRKMMIARPDYGRFILLIAIIIASHVLVVDGANCFADGGGISGEMVPCTIPFRVETMVNESGTQVLLQKIYKACAPFEEPFLPLGVRLQQGSVDMAGWNLPTGSSTSTLHWCSTEGFYSTNQGDSFKGKWGFCNCGEEYNFPTNAPTTSSPTLPTPVPTKLPSISPTLAPTNLPSTSPTTSEPTQSPTLEPTWLPTTSPTQGCRTIGGWQVDTLCVFPFTFNGVTYAECIQFADPNVSHPFSNENLGNLPENYEFTEAWCATTPSYDVESKTTKKEWGLCAKNCYTRMPTASPTTLAPTSGTPTQTPTERVPTAAPTESPTTKEPTLSPTSLAPTSSPTMECRIDGGYQFERETHCTFPFEFEGKTYTDCIPFSTNILPFLESDTPDLDPDYMTKKAWCATTPDYIISKLSVRKKWGTCSCYTVAPTSSPTIHCDVDGVLNGAETDVDCGGPSCAPCHLNQTCASHTDCLDESFCISGTCELVETIQYNEVVSLPLELSSQLFSQASSVTGTMGDQITQALEKQITHGTKNSSLGLVTSTTSFHVEPFILTPDVPICVTDGGWAPHHTMCKFPFTYKNQTYYNCQEVNKVTPYWGNETNPVPLAPVVLYKVYWCPIVEHYSDLDVDIREKFGFCDCGENWPTAYPTSYPTFTFSPTSSTQPPTLPEWCDDIPIIENVTNELLLLLQQSAKMGSTSFSFNGELQQDNSTEPLNGTNGQEQIKLSIEFEVDDGQIKFQDKSSLIEALKAYIRSALVPTYQSDLWSQCTLKPTNTPTLAPSLAPTTLYPTNSPTEYVPPTPKPTQSPTKPTSKPTLSPTNLGDTRSPTISPTMDPTRSPTMSPTTSPSVSPTLPTQNPTWSPTQFGETRSPTSSPTNHPTLNPTIAPSNQPSTSPTTNPTKGPTGSPTLKPTANPTNNPTYLPTINPTFAPSKSPTTAMPTAHPTQTPSLSPTKSPFGFADYNEKEQKSTQLLDQSVRDASFTSHPSCLTALKSELAKHVSAFQIATCLEYLNCSCLEVLLQTALKYGTLCLHRVMEYYQQAKQNNCAWLPK